MGEGARGAGGGGGRALYVAFREFGASAIARPAASAASASRSPPAACDPARAHALSPTMRRECGVVRGVECGRPSVGCQWLEPPHRAGRATRHRSQGVETRTRRRKRTRLSPVHRMWTALGVERLHGHRPTPDGLLGIGNSTGLPMLLPMLLPMPSSPLVEA